MNKKKYDLLNIILSGFLSLCFLLLCSTIYISHISEHILIGAFIGILTIILYLPYYGPIFSLGWLSGTLYYLGREVRDYEKGTGGKNTWGFDIGGFFGPALGNLITFYILNIIYYRYKDKQKKLIISQI